METYKKKYKTFLEVMDKYEKIQSVFVLYCFCFFFNLVLYFFLPKNNTNAISQKIQNTRNIRIKQIKNSKCKNNTNPTFQKCKIIIIIIKKNKFKNEPESQPHVHFEKQEPICKINAKPTCFIFQTLQFRFCIFELFFFVFFSSCMFNSLQKTLL